MAWDHKRYAGDTQVKYASGKDTGDVAQLHCACAHGDPQPVVHAREHGRELLDGLREHFGRGARHVCKRPVDTNT